MNSKNNYSIVDGKLKNNRRYKVKTKQISLRVTEAEFNYIKDTAKKAGKNTTTYILDQLNGITDYDAIFKQYQDLGQLLYQLREDMNKEAGVTEEVQQTIQNTVHYFLQQKGKE